MSYFIGLKERKMNRTLIILISLFLATTLFAIDTKSYKFEYITTEDGLSQSTIESLYQDSRGLIWIGTRDGINRYNGRTFDIFTHDNKDTNTIGEGWVNTICEDHHGNIWIGTNSGICVFNTNSNIIRRLTTNEPGGNGKVAHITRGPDNKLWYGMPAAHQLVSYDIDNNNFAIYDYSHLETDATTTIFDIIFTQDGRLFLAIESDELLEFNRETEEFIVHSYLTHDEGRNYKKSIVENENGELYIGAENAGVHIYNPKTQESRIIEGLNNSIIKTKVLCISPSEVWIGTDGGGINIYDPTTGDVSILKQNNTIEQSLGESTVFNMLQDKDGNIWVGHYGSGLSIWKKYKEKFITFRNNPFDPTSLPQSVVTAIFEDSNGRLWIGQDGGGLSRYNPDQNNFTTYRTEEGNPNSLTSNVIITINENSEGLLILGTYAGGVMFFDPESEQVMKVINQENGLGTDNVWDIYNDPNGKHWFATLGAGLDIYDPVTETVTGYDNLGSTVVMKIVEAPDGHIWLATENMGITVLNPNDFTFETITTYENSPYAITGNDVKGLCFDENVVWIGTIGGGLNRIDLLTDSMRYYNTETGLSSNSLMSIIKDNSGNLWISSTKGLMKFNPSTEEVIVFDKAQGTQGNEYKYNADCKLSNGFLAFGGSGGFSIFHPDSIKSSPIIPALVLTDFKLYNQSATIGGKESVLKRSINSTDRIVLKHQHKVFTFEFASLDYTAPNKNLYRYKLDGYDEDWVEAGNKNYASYTNVRPGRYTFMLMGSNSDGVWSPEIIEVKVRIKPPFYKTKLFIILLISLIAYAVNLFIRERIRQNKLDKEKLQQKIDEGKKELNKRVQEIEKQKEEIRIREEKEKILRFTNTGIVKLSEIISRDRSDISKLSSDVISSLVDYNEANAGVIYLSDEDAQNNTYLYPSAQYCYDTKEEDNEKVSPGEGYVGTCFQNRKNTFITDMPEGKIVLSSGLGEYSIQNIAYIPILQDDDCLGVIEIGSIEKLEDFKIEFIEKIANNLGSVLAIEKANKTTKIMLEQNQQQSEELKAQEEELRQNLEEMHATQEEFQRQLDSVDELQAELDEAKETIKKLQKDE